MTHIEKLAAERYPIASEDNRHCQERCRKAFIAGANANKWVSVDDELPPMNTEVLTYSFSVGYLVDITPFNYSPTHWQPLPLKPQP